MQSLEEVQARVDTLMEGITEKVKKLVEKGYTSGAVYPQAYSNDEGAGPYELPNLLLRAALEETAEQIGPLGRNQEFKEDVANIRTFL